MKSINGKPTDMIAYSELKTKEIIYRINCSIERILAYSLRTDIKVIFASESFRDAIIENGKHLPLSSVFGQISHNVALNHKYENILFLTKDDFPSPADNMWNSITDYLACSLSFTSLHNSKIVSGYGSRGYDIIQVNLHHIENHFPIVESLPDSHLCRPQYLLEHTWAPRLIETNNYIFTLATYSFRHYEEKNKQKSDKPCGEIFRCNFCGQSFLNIAYLPVLQLGALYEKHIGKIESWERG